VIEIEPVSAASPVVKFRMATSLLGWPAYYTAAYWVDGLLVDSGCAHTADQLTAALVDRTVDCLVNTHSHEDHIGANAEIHQAFGCPILAHPDALSILQDPRRQHLQLYRRLIWGWPRPCSAGPIGEWIETSQFRFRVIPTPGHSPDHICLFEPDQGWLFSGDAFIGGRDRALREGYDIHQIIASLKSLAQLPVRLIFSGSGTVRADGQETLRAKIAYYEALGERIRSLHQEGMSPRRIRQQVLGPKMPIAYLTFGHFSGTHLVHSYLNGF
jgi:glyoxylase-like metal-dependent hydrolase (beta-lactamase superfamily II)